MVIQAYAHACAGGCFGNEFGGAGEDIRIGKSICQLGKSKVLDLPELHIILTQGVKSWFFLV